MNHFSLKKLEGIVAQRASVTDGSSYTANLVSKGMPQATKKLGEEAVETIIAALGENKARLVSESADLLYHLLVVWHISSITLDDITQELEKRTAQSGLQEKATRNHG